MIAPLGETALRREGSNSNYPKTTVSRRALSLGAGT